MSSLDEGLEKKAIERAKELDLRTPLQGIELRIWIDAYGQGYKDGDKDGYAAALAENRVEELGVE